MKQLQLFMTKADERSLSALVVERWPAVTFVDDNVWSSPVPVTQATISACASPTVFIWNRALVGALPYRRRADGSYEGPIVGPVVQLVRSQLKAGVLISGRVAASSTDTTIGGFIEALWKALKGWGVSRIRSVDPASGETITSKVPGYLVGPETARWCIAEGGRLRDRSTQNYFAPDLEKQTSSAGRTTMR